MIYGEETKNETAELAQNMTLGDRAFSSKARDTTTYNLDAGTSALLLKGAFVPGFVLDGKKDASKAGKGRTSTSTRASFQTSTTPCLIECGEVIANTVAELALQTPEWAQRGDVKPQVPNPFAPKSEEYTNIYLKTAVSQSTTWVNGRGVEIPPLDLDRALSSKESPPIPSHVYLTVSNVPVSPTSPDVSFQLAAADAKILDRPLSRFSAVAANGSAASTTTAAQQAQRLASPQAAPAPKRHRTE